MNTTARMKGNRSSAGETLPGAPLEWAPSRNPVTSPAAEDPSQPAKQPLRWRRRAVVITFLALIGAAGLVIAIFVAMSDGSSSDASTAPQGEGEDASVALALPGTPTPTTEPTASPTDVPATAASTSAAAAPSASSEPAALATAAPPTAAPATVAAPVRVRYEIIPGDSCDLVRQKFGFPAAELADFSTALSRISGRTPANQCAFRQGDVVCIPTPADLDQLDKLTPDTGCLLGGAPAASGS